MTHAGHPSDSSVVNAQPARPQGQQGYALLIVLLIISGVAFMTLNFQMGKIRDTRYQTYYALGQDFALLAHASHIYVQDYAYYNPYVTETGPSGARQVTNVAYFQSLLTTKIAAFREPLIDITGMPAPDNALGRFTLADLQASTPGDYNGYVDADFNFSVPIRGVRYNLFGYGGLLPLRTLPQLQGASALIVLYGRPVNGVDIRNSADMSAFRAGAASNGLNRVGIVLPPARRSGMTCNGQVALVVWGNARADCLTAADASNLGMALQPYDIVAPAWESIEKQLVQDVIYRRPQPGMQATNIMHKELRMDGAGGYGATHNITDAEEIFTDSVNIEAPSHAAPTLAVGNTAVGAPAGDAMLVVGRADNPYYTYSTECPRATAGACINGPITIKKDMAVSYLKETNPDVPPKTPPTFLMKVAGGVDIRKGNLTVNADDVLHNGAVKGFFDVKGAGGSHTFQVNSQSNGGNGTVINKTVNVNNFTVTDNTGTENFVVDDELAIKGGRIAIGTDAKPAQVVLASAPLRDVSIDTSGKGAGSGVYGSNVEVTDFNQTAATPVTLKKVQFGHGSGTVTPSLTVSNNIVVDPAGLNPNNDCVGIACPDYVTTPLPAGSVPF